jgi:hypothetical protein
VAYVSTLKDVDWNKIVFHDEVTEDPACATGACPVR